MAAEEAADAVQHTAKHKIAGVPIIGWAIGVGAALGLFLLYRNRQAAASTDPGITTAGGTTDTAGNLSSDPYAADASSAAAQAAAATPDPITTNDDWRTIALTRLGLANYNPFAANSALGKWLDGESLDSTEQAIVTAALALTGPTPQAPPVPQPGSGMDAPEPAPAPDPTPASTFEPAPTPVQGPAPGPTPEQTHNAAVAATYLANFTRPQYWWGDAADAAAGVLRALGYTVPAPTPAARREHYLSTHPSLAAAIKAGGTQLTTFRKNNPGIWSGWQALQ